MADMILRKVREELFDWRFIKFVLVGIINTFSCSFFAWLCLDIVLDANIAFVIGYFASNVMAYIMNGVWIFPSPLTWKGYGKFALSYVPNFICENLVVGLCYNLLGMPPVVSYLLAAVLAVPITYVLVKYFAFGGAKDNDK